MAEKLKSLQEIKLNTQTSRNEKIMELHKAIEDINAKIENLVINLEQAGTSALKYINKRIEELDNEKTQLEAEMNTCNYQIESIVLPNLTDWSSKSLDDKKEIARSLIEKVSIDYKNNITIAWKV